MEWLWIALGVLTVVVLAGLILYTHILANMHRGH